MARVAPSETVVEDISPRDPVPGGVLSITDMNPDFNNDGVVSPWEQQLYTIMKNADSDKDGYLTRQEVYEVMAKMKKETDEAQLNGGIPISTLNPDTDGDGQVEPWEKDVYSRIVAADTDHTGTISVRNLFDFIRSMSNEVKEAAKKGIPIDSLNPDTDGDGKVEAWEVDVFERIKAADEDQSGSINVKELFGVIKGAAESDRQKKLFRKLFVGASVLLVFMLLANMGLTGAVVFMAKDMATGSDGMQRSKSGAIVQTGTLEEIVQAEATTGTFTALVSESDVLRTRPSSVQVDFADGSMVTFPPLQIQIFATSALLANLQIGVRLRLKSGEAPIFEFTGSTQLTETTLPTGASDASARAGQAPALSAVSRISLFRKQGGFVNTPVGGSGRRLSDASGGTVPRSASQTKRETLAAVGNATKSGRIPLYDEAEQSKRPPPNATTVLTWAFTLSMSADATALCGELIAYSIQCEGASVTTAPTTYSVTALGTTVDLHAFRDDVAIEASARRELSPFTGRVLEHLKQYYNDVLSITRISDNFMRIAGATRGEGDRPHPIHAVHRASVRRALMQTHAGHWLKERKLAALHKTGLSEVHRRRLGWGDADFFYRGGDVANNRTMNADCYVGTDPGAYKGTAVTTTYDDQPCASWASAVQYFYGASATPTPSRICGLFGASVNTAFSASLDDDPITSRGYPRSPCSSSFFGGKPFCMTSNPWSAMTAPVDSCGAMYLEDMNKAYVAGYSKTETPIKPDWFWGLDRIQQEDAIYGADPHALLFDGTGVHVFVIDSGCNLNHADFAGRVGASYRAFGTDSDPSPRECDPADPDKPVSNCPDTDGHGTHCASTILGAQAGVAPGATLHCVGVFKGSGATSGTLISSGFSWIIDYYNRFLKPNGIPAIVSASLSGAGNSFMDRLFTSAEDAGMLVLAAAGNSDVDACTTSPARIGGTSPSAYLTIGASAVDDSKALFSNWGSCVNLWAPGVGILAAAHDSDSAMTVMSGTSMATPIAAGVAALAMEVAANASFTSKTQMTAPTASVVKDWMVRSALEDKITAMAPSSLVPVSFVSSMDATSSFQTGYFSKYITYSCINGAETCDPSLRSNDETRNVAETPNKLVHVPGYMQDMPAVANVTHSVLSTTCTNYDAPTYIDECPMTGTELCGASTTTAPDGTEVLRPYRLKTETCAPGCVCTSPMRTSYESCAPSAQYYIYLNTPCQPVYMIESEEVATALDGKALTWTPLPGGEAYELDVPVLTSPLDSTATGTLTAFWTGADGSYRYGYKPQTYPTSDDGVWMFGTLYSTAFYYYGVPYSSVYVYTNGYLCFSSSSFFSRKSDGTSLDEHFDMSAGPCFSFLLTDIDSGALTVYYQAKYVGGSWIADKQTWTFKSQALRGGDYVDQPGEPPPAVTVQVSLIFGSNQIEVRYGELDNGLSAIIGPSKGEGAPPGFVADTSLPLP